MNSEDRVRNRTLFIAGSTASGKSQAAVEIATHIGGEIVNADAFQLYRGLDVLTAKPTAEEIARVPHHLFSILDPAESSHAALFEALARAEIDRIIGRGGIPIIVGGSGLYLKTLTHGLSPLPPGDPDLRAELSILDPESRIRHLLSLDPDAQTTVDLANPRYVTRALEICILSGRPASVLQSEWASRKVTFQGILLHWDREILYERINKRTVTMLSSGAIDEVRSFGASGNELATKTAAKAIGIREIQSYLAGSATLKETTSAIQQATRRYAKRQRTWFKRETGFKSICLNPGDDASSAAEKTLALFPHLIP